MLINPDLVHLTEKTKVSKHINTSNLIALIYGTFITALVLEVKHKSQEKD